MAEAIYNQKTADIQSQYTQLKSQNDLQKGFAEIDDMNIENAAQQTQIYARQTRTSQQRGDQQITGLIKVVDNTGRVVVMFGYKPGAF